MTEKLWTPSDAAVKASHLTRFIDYVANDHASVTDYDALYRYSVDDFESFWAKFWQFSDIKASSSWNRVYTPGESPVNATWFEGARLNYAENCLRYRDDHVALLFRSETGKAQQMTYAELYQEVYRCRKLLEAKGITQGDRVAGYMSHNIEAVVTMLATVSMGAIWASCSPDFGVKGVYERLSQIEPKLLFTIDAYHYNGKPHDVLESAAEIARQIDSIESVIVVPFVDEAPDISGFDNAERYRDFNCPAGDIEFVQLPFDYPLYILFSSGTTGKPKCILHGAGGSLIQHLKEHQLHVDIKRQDKLFYFTTCGWMMWNWQVSGLASGCTLVLYDGSPFYPQRRSLWAFAEQEKITVFGTSARYISACAKARLKPGEWYDLSALRAILSTGSPLVAESFDYVYRDIKSDVMLSSISGGTDIVSCFVLGNPIRPVYRGEIQGRGLGMAVAVFDDDANPVLDQRGELVCTKPFPSRPLKFWGEADDRRYLDAYYQRFDNIWAQGDFAQITENDGVIIYGRSDAVLNPGGVRIGTAEIYQQVEKVDEVLESICIGQQIKDDVRVVLFVVLKEGVIFDHDLKTKIIDTIVNGTTRRHAPKKVIAVDDIPRTKSGKIVELAVRSVVHGEPVKNVNSLANPEALKLFENIAELKV